MNKSELIEKIAESAELSKKDAEKALNSFVDAVIGAVKDGDKVQLIGFGTFEPRNRAAREARDPRTGDKIHIDACVSPAFRAGKAFKDAVNK